MVFPRTPLPTTVELLLGSTWTDITSKVRAAGGVQITRGQRAENSLADPASLTLTLDNRGGPFSLRNPTGPYYGLIGRSTPIRVSVAGGGVRFLIGSSHNINTVDSAGLSITGDVDLRVDGDMPDWTGINALAVKWGNPSQRSWWLLTNDDGFPVLFWSSTGSNSLSTTATVPVPKRSGRLAVRATLDVDNGAGGNTVTFYTAPSLGGTWTQLGAAVTQAGVTSIFDSTAGVVVAGAAHGVIYGAKILQGIGGTERGNPDLAAVTSGASSFVDAAGNTWNLSNSTSDGAITNRRYRFHGEVAAWPQKWEAGEVDSSVALEAAGVLRRVGQGSSPLKSTMYQGITSLGNVVAYWPCEDGSDATAFASALGGPPMTWVGSPTLATDSDFASSAPLPNFNNSQWSGRVPSHLGTNQIQLRFLLHVPTGGTTENAIIARWSTTGTVRTWELLYGAGFLADGALQLKAYDSSGTAVLTTAMTPFGLNGKLCRVSIELSQDGTNIAHSMRVLLNNDAVSSEASGSLVGFYLVGRPTAIRFDYNGNMGDVTVGHVTLQSAITSLDDLHQEQNAYVGETAATRIARLCDDEGITCRIVGDAATSEPMGPQRQATFLDLLRECEATDAGILYELRDALGIAYRPRDSLYNRSTSVVLDYAAGEISTIDPVDDDQNTRNDVTVTRVNGSSARATQDSGPLGTTAPPDGAGRYATSISINPHTDLVLQDHAYWRLNLGTVDEARYPQVGLQLARPSFTAADRDAVMDVDVGDLLVVATLPAWLAPDDVSQGVVGVREDLGTFSYLVSLVCVPASPYRTGVYNDVDDRYSPAAPGTLNTSVTTTGTTLAVVTAAGNLWTTASVERPFDIIVGGERMTVTNLTGATSPQSFTVTRSVNGIVKTHAAGAEVELFDPTVYAL